MTTHDAFVDNGTNLSAIDVSLLPADFVKLGKRNVKSLGGKDLLDTTMVTLDLNGFRFSTLMLVGSDFGHDILLGTEIPDLHKMLAHKPRRQPARKCRRQHQIRDPSPAESSSSEDKPRPRPPFPDTKGSSDSETPLSDDAEPCPPLLTPTLDGGGPQLIRAQASDPSLKSVRRTAGLASSLYYFDSEGALYRSGKMTPEGTRIAQLVLPSSHRRAVLNLAHIAPLAGHFGVAKTTARITARFFWPGLRKEVKEMCKSCTICQYTAPRKSATAPLVALPVIRTPLQQLAMDMIGPLPVTAEGFRHILTVCDYGTRYPEAFPLKETTSRDVAEALLELFSRWGLPECILTDRGSNFCSSLTKEFLKLFGISSIRTAAYHPQTDGLVERYNGSLKTGIKRFIDQFPVEWNKALPFVLFAYRETPHTSTGFSPFELMFGRTARGPLDTPVGGTRPSTRPERGFLSHRHLCSLGSRIYHSLGPGSQLQGEDGLLLR